MRIDHVIYATADLDAAAAHVPFFIERVAVAAERSPAIRWIEVAGDRARIEEWLGDAELPLRVRTGERRVLALGVGAHELRAAQTWS